MTITTKFDIGERVLITDLERFGMIKSIFYGNSGVSYFIRYFNGTEHQEIYFFEEEIERPTKKSLNKSIGFVKEI